MYNLPKTSKELIEILHQENPHRCPTILQSEREIWVQVGRRQLIDELLMTAQQSGVVLDLTRPLEQEPDEGD